MKFTTVGPEGARNLLREKQRRNRMAAQELRVQFPQFASIRLDFEFSDETSQPPAPQSVVLHPPARAYFVYPCPYASCNGEFDLAAPVADIAERDATPPLATPVARVSVCAAARARRPVTCTSNIRSRSGSSLDAPDRRISGACLPVGEHRGADQDDPDEVNERKREPAQAAQRSERGQPPVHSGVQQILVDGLKQPGQQQ